METLAMHRHARSSAQKVRLVADLIRGKKVSQALEILTYTNKKAAGLVKKVLESAIANAEQNDGADIDDLKVAKIFVDEGPTMKRIMPRAKATVQIVFLSAPATLQWLCPIAETLETSNGSESTS